MDVFTNAEIRDWQTCAPKPVEAKPASALPPSEPQGTCERSRLATGSASFVLDCKGREILPGDTLKVFHYIGARRKRCYMYKYVLSVYKHPNWADGLDALRISHLNPQADSYLVLRRGQTEQDYEIVQGYGEDGRPFDEREKREPNVEMSHEPERRI